MDAHQVQIENWLKQGRSGDRAQQIAAIRELQDAEATEAIPTLLDLLASPDDWVRSSAAAALGDLGPDALDSVDPALVAALADAELLVRSEAAEALGALGYAPALAALSDTLENDPDPIVRASVAEALGNVGDAQAIKALFHALRLDPYDIVRGYAALALGLLGTPDILPKLQVYLIVEQSEDVRANLAGATYRLGAQDALGVLLSLLERADDLQAIRLLNIIDDLTQYKQPPSLAHDSASLCHSLDTLFRRHPFLHGHGRGIIARLQAFALGQASNQ